MSKLSDITRMISSEFSNLNLPSTMVTITFAESDWKRVFLKSRDFIIMTPFVAFKFV